MSLASSYPTFLGDSLNYVNKKVILGIHFHRFDLYDYSGIVHPDLS